jgi:phage terminase large subunit
MRDFFQILVNEGLYDPSLHNRSENSYRIGTNYVEFFSGDRVEKMKGARRDILFVNEAYALKYDVFDQLEVRTKWLVFIDFNPVAEFWVHDEILAKVPDECEFIHSTFKDNPYLEKRIIESILRHRQSEYWWKVYGEGVIGQLEGAIFQRWRYGEFDDSLPYSFGLDFGFNDPDALVKVAFDQKRKLMFWDEKIYKEGNSFEDLRLLISQHVTRNDLITADCADARMIDQLKKYFNIKPVNKSRWTVSQALRMMQDYEHVITETSTNLAREFKNYLWDDRRAGIPIDDFDHCIDAGRYRFMETINKNQGAVWHV